MDSEEKKYKCEKCGSESQSTPGMCCDEERKEACISCDKEKGEMGKCACK